MPKKAGRTEVLPAFFVPAGVLRFVRRTELAHFADDRRFDRVASWCQEFARIVDFMVSRHDFTDFFREGDLVLRVHVDLGRSEGDGFLDVVRRDARAAVQYERKLDRLADLGHFLEAEVRLPFVRAVDGAQSRSQAVDACQLDQLEAFFRICVDNAVSNDVVFLAADRAELGFNGNAFAVRVFNDFLRRLDVLVERMVGSVDHDGSEAGIDGFFTFVEAGAVVEVDGNRNRDFHFVDQSADDGGNDFEAAHVAGRAFGYAENDRGLLFLCRSEDRLRPLQVVDVVLADGVALGKRFVQHVLHGNECHCNSS
ncbi:hypothetical protein BN871_EU_00140 [Paenibacillus sp. P22]|nr:hypothetical protein BN871_EU_00140 [Paenibacillus sp. P22]